MFMKKINNLESIQFKKLYQDQENMLEKKGYYINKYNFIEPKHTYI